ncbi:MAG: hypothetical protein ACOX8R_02230 [Bacillota bacterium]|jgi:hypothetical protein
MDDIRIVEGAVTLELHGYLTSLKINLPEEEDIEGGDYDLAKTLFEAGIHTAAVEKAIVNGSLVHMRHKIKPGDYIIVFPMDI